MGRWTGCGHHIRIRVEHDLVRTGRRLVLGIIAFMRVGFFDLGQLFAGRSDDSNESAEAKNADEPEETVESTERTEVNA